MKEMPEHLPKLPEGAVYLGECEEVITSSGEHEKHDGWHKDAFNDWGQKHTWIVGPGSGPGHFAAPADSEIARLNGFVKPSWEDAPKWAEWRTQDADGDWSWFSHKPEKHEILDFWCTPGASKWEHAFEGPPNPNFQDTLERRPRKSSKLELKIDASELREALDSAIRGAKESGELPDLVIPKDAADHIGLALIVEGLCSIGYRVEVNRGIVRGWARG